MTSAWLDLTDSLDVIVERGDVSEIEVVRVALPLLHEHRAAHGTESMREAVLVRVDIDGATGWGECSALTHPTYSHEYAGGAFRVLVDEVAPWLLGRGHRVVANPMALSAVLSAHLDAGLRARDLNLAAHLGQLHGRPAATLPVTAVIGRSTDIDELLAIVERRRSEGAALVKLKVSSHPDDLQAVITVRSTWPSLALAVDANGSLDQRSVGVLEGLGLAYVEQPAPAEDLLMSANLAERLSCPVALDESIGSLGSLRLAVAVGAGLVLNVKPARLGGPAGAAALAREALDLGWEVFVGGMLETGVGRASAACLASLPMFRLPTDLGPSRRYFDRDVTDPVTLDENGRLVVPVGPGSGVWPDLGTGDQRVLDRVTLKR